jgi:hypothetical protein
MFAERPAHFDSESEAREHILRCEESDNRQKTKNIIKF